MKKPAPRVDTEEWLPYPDSPLEVSNRGNVRSRAYGLTKPRRLSPGPRPMVSWRTAMGKVMTRQVARLVLELFVGEKPPGGEPAYADGDTTNCRVTNLSWGPRKHRGKTWKLKGPDVLAARRLAAIGAQESPKKRYWTQKRIGKALGVSGPTISHVVNRKTHRGVEDPGPINYTS